MENIKFTVRLESKVSDEISGVAGFKIKFNEDEIDAAMILVKKSILSGVSVFLECVEQ